MIKIQSFTFNGFQENTYILFDESKTCIIIDPGCYEENEKLKLEKFIVDNELEPVKLINTHCHIDHVLGNHFVAKKWGLDLEIHEKDLSTLHSVKDYCQLYGFHNYEQSPEPSIFLKEGDKIHFGNSSLDILFTPGHAPGHIVLHSKEQHFVIGGDVLFQMSIGRTDLPGGDYDTLINSIKDKLLPLDEQTKVYCGHGPSTSIGFEKMNNSFLK
ncbi:MAG: MBL fold metallo-hydrolase [Flavobacteriales bacterium]|nr:MBL fold metallo-hydrolase [Flavobacteriales bacterium]MBL6872911.1 MBL fold metallo-hydrolase [Flavobacteriales bacterium]